MNNIKVKYKLAMIYFVAGFLPMLLLFTFSYSQLKKIITDNETKNIDSYLYQTTASMDSQLTVYNNLSNYISFNTTISQVVSYDYSSKYEMYNQFVSIVDPMLSSLKYFHEDVNQVTIYMEGSIRHDTTIAPISDIYKEEWFKNASDELDIIWNVNYDKKTVFSARKMAMLDRNDILGILYINVNYDKLYSSFMAESQENYGIFITDNEGKLLYDVEEFQEDYSGLKLDYNEFIKEKDAGYSDYTVISQKSDVTGWNVYMYKPKSLIIESAEPMILIAAVAAILGGLAMIIGIFASSKLISKRLEKLKENMEEVENGNMVISVRSTSGDEIGDLIRGFGKMIAQIQTLISEVYEGRIHQKEYEMRALQAQINPHFLYNSLSLINWKAIEAGKEEISDITLALSTYYRTSLNKGKNTLAVEDEINNMKAYMRIQLVMHDNDFDVKYDISDEILKYESLNLILQPLIENAIDHGIDLLTNKRGIITITGRLIEDKNVIRITVEDNGVGMEQEKIDILLTKNSKGYGIRNVNERIKLYYGDEYELKVESVIDFGTKITINIPAKIFS